MVHASAASSLLILCNFLFPRESNIFKSPERFCAAMMPEKPAPNEPTLDRGTQLAEERTSMALQRNLFAAERTLMAWIRTALSMISFGFTMIKFFQYLETSHGPTVGLMGRTWTPEAVGFAMMAIGTGALCAAVMQHRRELKLYRAEGLKLHSWSLAFSVAALVALLGLFAFVTVLTGH